MKKAARKREPLAAGPPWPALATPRTRPASRAICSFFESESKASKTPPSHGFRGFAAIKARARKAGLGACGSANRLVGRPVKANKKRLEKAPDCALWRAWPPLKPWRMKKAARKREPLAAGPPWPALATPRTRPASRAICSFFESESKAPKTPPSHGFRGFAAIKAGARNRPCSALFFRPHPAPGLAFRGPERPLPARQWPRSGQRK